MIKRFIKVLGLLLIVELILATTIIFSSTSDFHPLKILVSIIEKIIGFPVNMVHRAYPFYAETATKGIILFIINLLIQSVILYKITIAFTDVKRRQNKS